MPLNYKPPILKVDEIFRRRCRVFCKDGRVLVGKGTCTALATISETEEEEAVKFDLDDGDWLVLAESEIDRFEYLD